MVAVALDFEAYRHRRETKREQDMRIELMTLRKEALEFVESLLPYVRRMHLVTHEVGPSAQQLSAAIEYRLTRYGRRFDETPPEAA